MVSRFIYALGLSIILLAYAEGAQPRGATELGLRLGLFSNSHNEMGQSTNDVRLFANQTNIYVEGFIDYYLTSWLALALNLGSYSKGDIRLDVYINGALDGSFIGTASIYPVQVGIKLSPFKGELPLRSLPYLEGGVALIVGRTTAYSQFARYSDGVIGSETDLGWWIGGGVEIPLADRFQLDLMVKYINTKFSGDIAGIKDYSGLQASVGVGFIHLRKQEGGERK